MIAGPVILVVTRSDDHAGVAAVCEGLVARGLRPVRWHTDRHPLDVRLSTRLTPIGGTRRRLVDESGAVTDLNDVAAVWYRRFLAGGTLPATLGDLRPACVEESRRTSYGMLAALGDDAFVGVPQLDPVEAVRRCDHKELQLTRARALSLRVPDTLFSNDPDEAAAFINDVINDGGVVVTKMQSSFSVWRDGAEHVVFTSVVDDAALADLPGLRLCPMQFQRRIHKRLELRATVVGDDVFCAAVDSQQQERTSLDWRKDGRALLRSWTRFQLPVDVERALVRLVHSFGLQYAAADLIVTPDDDLVFLEINAGGEWFWLDEHCHKAPGLPIADAIAGWLARAARAR